MFKQIKQHEFNPSLDSGITNTWYSDSQILQGLVE
jgi:hypothetical protein